MICFSAVWIAYDQTRLEHGVLDQLVPFTQGQKDSLYTGSGIAVRHEQYSGAEIMHSLRELAIHCITVEIDGVRADLNGVDSDDYSVQDASVIRASGLLDLTAGYGVQMEYDMDGRARKISFFKE